MAEIIEGDYRPKHVGPPTLYPWDEWLDGQRRRLHKGKDFECELRSLEKLIRRAASKRPEVIHVQINYEEDALVVKADLGEVDLKTPMKRNKPKRR